MLCKRSNYFPRKSVAKYVDEGGALKDQDNSLGTLKDDVQSLHDQGWSYSHKLTSRGWGLQAANTPTRMSYIEISKVPR